MASDFEKCKFCAHRDDINKCMFCAGWTNFDPDCDQMIRVAKEKGISVSDLIALIDLYEG